MYNNPIAKVIRRAFINNVSSQPLSDGIDTLRINNIKNIGIAINNLKELPTGINDVNTSNIIGKLYQLKNLLILLNSLKNQFAH